MQGVTVQGLDQALRHFDKAPAELMKASRTAVRAGARAALKKIKPRTPERWRRLLKVVVKKNTRGELSGAVGLFNIKTETNGKQSNAKQPVSDWFKAYWSNYGTLANRDPSHHFDHPVKPAQIITNYDSWRRSGRRKAKQTANRRRNNTGQKAQNFFEKATVDVNKDYINGFTKSLERQGYDLK